MLILAVLSKYFCSDELDSRFQNQPDDVLSSIELYTIIYKLYPESADPEVEELLCRVGVQLLCQTTPMLSSKREYSSVVQIIVDWLQVIWKGSGSIIALNKCRLSLEKVFSLLCTHEKHPSNSLAAMIYRLPHNYSNYCKPLVLQGISNGLTSIQLCNCLVRMCHWALKGHIYVWVEMIIQSLIESRQLESLFMATPKCIDAVVTQLNLEQTRDGAFAVLKRLLFGYSCLGTPAVFHMSLPALGEQIDYFCSALIIQNKAGIDESHSAKSDELIATLSSSALEFCAEMCFTLRALMYIHGGYPKLYSPLLEKLEQLENALGERKKEFNPNEIQTIWKQNVWTTETQAANYVSSDDFDTVVASKMKSGLTGLDNLGNTCYLNSLLQALYSTHSFRRALLLWVPNVHVRSQQNQAKSCAESSGHNSTMIAKETQILFAQLMLSTLPAVDPSALLRLLPPQFRSGQQQDASEFAKYFLDILSKVSGFGQELISVFYGKTITETTCGGCSNVSVRMEDFVDWNLPLEGPDDITITQLVNASMKEEYLDGENSYHCDSCQSLQPAIRCTHFESLPSHLVLTLNRFEYDLKAGERNKICKTVTLEENLLISSHIFKPQVSTMQTVLSEPIVYTLNAIVIHSGMSALHGHYYCICRDMSSDDESSWVLVVNN